MKRLLSVFGCLALLLTAVCPVSVLASAESSAEAAVVYIDSAEDLLKLAENCVQDTYSQNLTVCLRADIDLTDKDFSGIPYFAGTFDGDGHTISGLTIDCDGSRQGLFRTAAETAVIEDLQVFGSVTPGGSACMVGGIVGENSGALVRCGFQGTVSGSEQVGGVVGENTETASLTLCSFSGDVTGSHRVGGICGSSSGLILRCSSTGSVNTVEVDSETTLNFDISSLYEEQEEIIDVSDIGGIVGYNGGITRSCNNRGDVGYARVGYNIGGVVGRGTGLLYDCVNSGSIFGRKDVGGIVGQLEPRSEWDFSESKLEELNNAVSGLGDAVDTAAENLGSGADAAASQLGTVAYYINQAGSDLNAVISGTAGDLSDIAGRLIQVVDLIDETLGGEDAQALLERIEALRNAIQSLGEDGIQIEVDTDFEGSAEGASGEISASSGLEEQITAVLGLIDELISAEQTALDSGTLAQMMDILSGVYISTPDFSTFFNDFSSAVSAADGLNAVVSSLSSQTVSDVENIVSQVDSVYTSFFSSAENVASVDTDWQVDISDLNSDDLSGGAVISCVNTGDISADTDVGGIAGNIAWEVSFDMEDELNLSDYLLTDAKYLISAVVSDCSSCGDITAREECAGGITGTMSFGAVGSCTASGTVTVTDGDYCGGIVGRFSGRISDCWTRTTLSGGAYVGGIAGEGDTLTDCVAYAEITAADEYVGAVAGAVDSDISGCRYIDCGYGAVDGVTFADEAGEISYDELSADDTVPDELKTLTVTFVLDGTVYETVSVPYGGAITDLPQVPDSGAQYWKWDDFDADNIRYSRTVNGAWYDPLTTLSSGEEPADILVEGTFYEYHSLTVGEFIPQTNGTELQDANILAAYKLSVNNEGSTLNVRLRMADEGTLYLLNDDGSCSKTDYTRDGTYICFTMPNGGRFVFTDTVTPAMRWTLYVIPAGSAVLIAAALTIILVRKKKGKKKKRRPVRTSD